MCYIHTTSVFSLQGADVGQETLDWIARCKWYPPGTVSPGVNDPELVFYNTSDKHFGLICQGGNGPPEYPPAPCGSPVTAPSEGDPDVPPARGYTLDGHLREPSVIKIRYARELDSNDEPTLTTPGDYRKDEFGRVVVRIPPTANGGLVIQPPETDVQHHYGHLGRSGASERATMGDNVSDTHLTLFSAEDGAAATKGVQLNCGFMAVGTINPASGWYLKRTAPGAMKIQTTAADGSDDNTGTITINGTTWQSILDRLDALEAL
jgi:hypothetical protein